MGPKERFKVAFLALCADQGMTLGEALVLVKHANASFEKQADPVWDTTKSITGRATDLAGEAIKQLGRVGFWGLLAAPPAAGLIAGGTLAKVRGAANDQTPEELKNQELIDELRRQTEFLNAQHALAQQRNARRTTSGRSLL